MNNSVVNRVFPEPNTRLLVKGREQLQARVLPPPRKLEDPNWQVLWPPQWHPLEPSAHLRLAMPRRGTGSPVAYHSAAHISAVGIAPLACTSTRTLDQHSRFGNPAGSPHDRLALHKLSCTAHNSHRSRSASPGRSPHNAGLRISAHTCQD